MRAPAPLLALVLALPALLAGGALANHTGLPVAFADAAEGPASWGVRVDADASGRFTAQITACGAKPGSTDGVGALLLHADRSFRFGVMVTGHFSNDRQVVDAGPADVEVVVRPSWGSICPYSRLELEVGGAPATHYLVVWGAGLDGTTKLEVFGGPGTRVAAVRGTTLALGDPELQDATAQAQVQQRLVGFHGAGAKAMLGARAEVEAGQRLWGLWGFHDAKFACAGTCLGPMQAEQACQAAAGQTCLTSLSWQGPAGQGAGRSSFLLLGEPPGRYTFTVDRKADAYNPGGGAFVPPGVLVFATENYSFLSVADVALPP